MMTKYKNVLYVYSDSVDNKDALKKTVMIAEKNNASLTVVFTISHETLPNSLSFAKEKIEAFIDQKEAERDRVISQFSNIIAIKKDSIYSNSYIDIIKKVQQHNFDLVVKPSENEGVLGAIFGSNDMGYLRHSPCHVWLINVDDEEKTKSIIAAIDVDDNYPEDDRLVRESLNLDILKTAISIAKFRGYNLKIVSAWSAKYESALRNYGFIKNNEDDVNAYVNEVENKHLANFDAFMAKAKNTLDETAFNLIKPECILLKGNAKIVLPQYAKKINTDLVVMGTVARVGIPGLIIGNTAENILYQLDQSVLAIKPKGFNSLIGK